MNANLLLAHYEKIADAPDAIPRLRRFILDLAVRGKLVEQDPNDEPVETLLERVAVKREKLVKAGKIRNRTPLASVKKDESPFGIPATWCWVRFGNIADFSAGRTPSRNEPSFWNSGDHAWVSIADMKDGETLISTKETVTKKAAKQVFGVEPEQAGTMIMSFKLTIGKIARLGIPAYHNEAIISIRPCVADLDPHLFRTLPMFARQGNTKGAIKGHTLNRKSISNILLPLPPLAEQCRIVAKVDKLMALCDRLEEARTEREVARDRLAAASLARLNSPNPDPAKFQSHETFALDNLIPLAARPDQIKNLRQTILNLAVRGKLVNQDPNDEPVETLLERIAAKKEKLVKAGKIRSRAPLASVKKDESPFGIPATWCWIRFGNIADFSAGRTPSRNEPSFWNSGDHAWVSIADMKDGETLISTKETVTKKAAIQVFGVEPAQAGTMIMSFKLTIGKIARLGVPAYHNEAIISIRPYVADLDPHLFRTLPMFARQGNTKGAIKGHTLNRKSISTILLPLPPLAEQSRIVAKVDELMALCDRLEASLTTSEDTRRRLLDACCSEALAEKLELRKDHHRCVAKERN